MAKSMKKLDSKLQKQQQGWPKISHPARKYNKDENQALVVQRLDNTIHRINHYPADEC